MESLSQNTVRDFHDIIRDNDQFEEIIVGELSLDLQESLRQLPHQLERDPQEIQNVIIWAANSLGDDKLASYLHDYDFSPDQMVAALALAKTSEQRQAWQTKYGGWERRPSVSLRYEQLAMLKQRQETIQQTYPEIELKLMRLPYKDIEHFMPPFRASDTATDRITHPATPLARLYGGNIAVDSQLLKIIRGELPTNRQGIDYYQTPYGDLQSRINTFENDGLCLIAKHQVPIEAIQDIERITGVNCSGANLAVGIALALKTTQNGEPKLRIGDDITLPEYITSQDGDSCSGLRIIPEYTPYGDIPRLYFDRRSRVDAQNCVLVVKR